MGDRDEFLNSVQRNGGNSSLANGDAIDVESGKCSYMHRGSELPLYQIQIEGGKIKASVNRFSGQPEKFEW